MFDTYDKLTTGNIFNEMIADTKLSSFMKQKTVDQIALNYKEFIDNLARKYKEEGKLKNFPLFGLKNINPSG